MFLIYHDHDQGGDFRLFHDEDAAIRAAAETAYESRNECGEEKRAEIAAAWAAGNYDAVLDRYNRDEYQTEPISVLQITPEGAPASA